MKKSLIALMLTAICAITLTGCFQAPQANQNQPENKPEVKNDVTLPPAETLPAVKITEWDPNKYEYDNTKGVLVDLTDNNKVLYTNPNHPDSVLHIQGMEGDKLIVWETGSDNSPGPCYSVWTDDTVYGRVNIKYLDLKNTSAGLKLYTIPQYKIDLEETQHTKCDAEIQGVSEQLSSYVSDEFEFMIDFPATWMGFDSKVETVQTARTITLTSKADKERYIKLFIIDKGDNEPALQVIGETRNYIIFLDDSIEALKLSDELRTEYEKIYDSFAEIMKGRYSANSYYGYMLMFAPKDDEANYIYLTNQEEAAKTLGLKLGEPLSKDCSDYSGDAVISVRNLEKMEDQTHTPPYSAELVKVVNYYAPSCDE